MYETEQKAEGAIPNRVEGRQKAEGQDVLRLDALAGLPPELLKSLEHAAITANMSEIIEIIDEIRSYDAVLAEAITQLTDNFDYATILNVIQQMPQ